MRIRSIKPEFWRSPDVADLCIEDRLLWIGLWSYVDDNGVGKDRAPVIAADLFAFDLSRDAPETLARVSRGLQNLSEADRITRYTVAGDDYLCINNWSAHQRIDKPNKARYPAPTSDDAELRETLARPSRDPRETPSTGTGEQGNRGAGDQGSSEGRASASTRKRATQLPDDWTPNDGHRQQASERGVDIALEADKMRDWAAGKGEARKDWDAVFRNWLRNARPQQQPRGAQSTTSQRLDRAMQLQQQLLAQEGQQTWTDQRLIES